MKNDITKHLSFGDLYLSITKQWFSFILTYMCSSYIIRINFTNAKFTYYLCTMKRQRLVLFWKAFGNEVYGKVQGLLSSSPKSSFRFKKGVISCCCKFGKQKNSTAAMFEGYGR